MINALTGDTASEDLVRAKSILVCLVMFGHAAAQDCIVNDHAEVFSVMINPFEITHPVSATVEQGAPVMFSVAAGESIEFENSYCPVAEPTFTTSIGETQHAAFPVYILEPGTAPSGGGIALPLAPIALSNLDATIVQEALGTNLVRDSVTFDTAGLPPGPYALTTYMGLHWSSVETGVLTAEGPTDLFVTYFATVTIAVPEPSGGTGILVGLLLAAFLRRHR